MATFNIISIPNLPELSSITNPAGTYIPIETTTGGTYKLAIENLNIPASSISGLGTAAYRNIGTNESNVPELVRSTGGFFHSRGVLDVNRLPDNIPIAKITGYGNVVYRNAGTAIGNVPFILSDGKLPSEVIPSIDIPTDYVDLSNNQTIGGVKTFSSNPQSSNLTPTLDAELATKYYVDQTTPEPFTENYIIFRDTVRDLHSLNREYTYASGWKKLPLYECLEYPASSGALQNFTNSTFQLSAGIYSVEASFLFTEGYVTTRMYSHSTFDAQLTVGNNKRLLGSHSINLGQNNDSCVSHIYGIIKIDSPTIFEFQALNCDYDTTARQRAASLWSGINVSKVIPINTNDQGCAIFNQVKIKKLASNPVYYKYIAPPSSEGGGVSLEGTIS